MPNVFLLRLMPFELRHLQLSGYFLCVCQIESGVCGAVIVVAQGYFLALHTNKAHFLFGYVSFQLLNFNLLENIFQLSQVLYLFLGFKETASTSTKLR